MNEAPLAHHGQGQKNPYVLSGSLLPRCLVDATDGTLKQEGN